MSRRNPALLQRLWIVPLSIVVVAALAYGVARLQSASYTAQATVVVTSAPGPVSSGSATAAGDLAATYSAALPYDEGLQGYVSSRIGAPTSGSISALPSKGAVVRLAFSAPTRSRALAGARAIADAVSGGGFDSSLMASGSLRVLHRPTGTTATAAGDFRAAVTLVVPPSAGPTEGINPADAEKLATTYAGIIPTDDRLLADVGRTVGESSSQVSQNLSVVNAQNTAILQISFKSPDPRRAAAGARSVAALLSGPSPVAAGVIPSSIQIVSNAQPPGAASGHGTAAIAIGAALGLLLGLVLLVAWERSDPRIRDPRELGAQIGCPATPIERLSHNAAYALLERWAGLTDTVPARVAVLPADAGARAQTATAVRLLSDSADKFVHSIDARHELPDNGEALDPETGVVLVHAGPPGGQSAGEAVALGCDLTVVVVPTGMRATRLRELADELANFGIVPVWALLSPGGRPAVRRPRETVGAAST